MSATVHQQPESAKFQTCTRPIKILFTFIPTNRVFETSNSASSATIRRYKVEMDDAQQPDSQDLEKI